MLQDLIRETRDSENEKFFTLNVTHVRLEKMITYR